jgi:carotenoid cleavage dioxygenase
MTERHVILHDLPVVFDQRAIAERMWRIKVADQPTRFGVVPRAGGAVRWFEFPTCYVYHVINAWEEGDEVVMAACKMVPNGFSPDFARHGAYAPMAVVLALRAEPHLFRMNLATGAAREERLDDRRSEFPVVDGRRVGRKTRHAYHVVMDDCVEQRFSALLKYDLGSGAALEHAFPPGVFGSEPAFAPRPGGTAEDDGYLVTFVNDAATNTSEALVIAADDFTSPPLARVKLPRRVPAGFHGTWLAAE